METKDVIAKLIQSKESIIFCGAGISYNSGIPTVDPFISYLFRQLEIQENHIEVFKKTKFPFEALMEMIDEMVDVNILFEVFNYANPNPTHFFLANLLTEGYTKIIITTNFDQNIECALKELGVVQHRDYILLSTQEDIVNFKYEPNKKYIIKIHGSISNTQSIMTFIRNIASQKNISEMEKFFEKIFVLPQKNIIFFGYSFSDHFDINPALKKISRNKNLYILQHQELNVQETTETYFNKSINKTCFIHSYNTDKLIKELDNSHKKISIAHRNWKIVIDNWIKQKLYPYAKNTGVNNKDILRTNFFIRSNNFEIGSFYLQSATKEISANSNHAYQTDVLYKIGLLYLQKGKLEKNRKDLENAKQHFLKAEEIAKRNNDLINSSIYKGILGHCYMELKDYEKAIECHTQAMNYFGANINNLNHPYLEIMRKRYCENVFYLGAVYRNQREFLKSNLFYNKALIHENKYGFLDLKELTLYGLGLLNEQTNDFVSALKFFEEGLQIAKNLSLIERVFQNFSHICFALNNLYGHEKVLTFFNSHIDLVERFDPRFSSIENILKLFR